MPRRCGLYLRLDNPRAGLVQALRLLAEVSFSTASAEKQQASSALIRRHHPDNSADVLASAHGPLKGDLRRVGLIGWRYFLTSLRGAGSRGGSVGLSSESS